MSLSDDLNGAVKEIFEKEWSTRTGQVIPNPEDIKLGNEAVEFEAATVLYADLTGSTSLVNTKKWWFSAEIYKTFLYCAARIVRSQGGSITSYDGDRIMGVFIGDSQYASAARCALKINSAVHDIINPKLKTRYPTANYVVKQVVGIDCSQLKAARTGVRGGNDIVWIGRAANYAAKLTEIKATKSSWLTKDFYEKIPDSVKFGGDSKKNMWSKYTWNENNDLTIYGSNWKWSV